MSKNKHIFVVQYAINAQTNIHIIIIKYICVHNN